jgi:hypothetical protein
MSGGGWSDARSGINGPSPHLVPGRWFMVASAKPLMRITKT